MKDQSDTQHVLTGVIRWTARAWTLASIGLTLAFIVGEGNNPSGPTEWIGFLFFPVGICAGMILAWWREGLGGSITVGSLGIFYMLHFATVGTLPKGWAWLVFAAPGLLFLFCWQRSRSAKTTNA
ncbi:MAG: hypothetical protein HYY24_22910 [Verrucomicrobia bacterium]|nr:hypothetical protein [Verrucomicrobiota bacterium]